MSFALHIEDLIRSYGYLAVALGAFLEGETVLVIAGAAAYRAYLWLPAVIAVATVASFLGDQLYFFVGRRYGTRLLERFPSMRARAARVNALLERHHVPLILAIRFLYGLRIAGPIAIGMSGVSWRRFLVLNFAGATVWAIIIAGAGYGFGQGLAYALGGIDADEIWLAAVLLLSGTVWWLFARRNLPARSEQ